MLSFLYLLFISSVGRGLVNVTGSIMCHVVSEFVVDYKLAFAYILSYHAKLALYRSPDFFILKKNVIVMKVLLRSVFLSNIFRFRSVNSFIFALNDPKTSPNLPRGYFTICSVYNILCT